GKGIALCFFIIPLPDLIDLAKEQGIKLVACQMTVDLLGLKEEEIMEGVEFAGVGAYLADASDGNVNLFI
ncbi:DsrE/DsrF/DrsH-like family protein, partial [Bacillus sp. B-TM1]